CPAGGVPRLRVPGLIVVAFLVHSSPADIRYYHRRIDDRERDRPDRMHGTDHLDALRRDASSAPVVLFASPLTDLREPEARLAELGLDRRAVTLSLLDATSRDRFHVRADSTGRHVAVA